MKSTVAKLARQNAIGTGLIMSHLNAKLKKQPSQVSGISAGSTIDVQACLA